MAQGILSGSEILKEIREKRIEISPFDESKVNPASVDLTLGTKVLLYEDTFYCHSDPGNGAFLYPLKKGTSPLDTRKVWPTKSFEIDPNAGWTLKPGIGYLMHTNERVRTDYYVPVLDGKSSVGRAFIKVHETAGYGDPGFDGQYTLEVTSQYEVIVYPGMPFCQIRFHTICGDVTLYEGRYQGEKARGAVASRTWEQQKENLR